MPRPEKVKAVADIKERIAGSQAVFLAEYAGLSVKDQQALRRELRESGAEFKVVKMTLARRAAGELEIDTLDELLLGPTGLAFAEGDPVGAAKVLKGFSKDHSVFVIKGGLLGTDFLSPERISELAEIEPRDVLLAQLAGAMKAPLANLAGLMAALPRNTASVFQQLLEQKEVDQPTADSGNAPRSLQPTTEEDSGASLDAEESKAEAAEGATDPKKTEDEIVADVVASTDAEEETEEPQTAEGDEPAAEESVEE